MKRERRGEIDSEMMGGIFGTHQRFSDNELGACFAHITFMGSLSLNMKPLTQHESPNHFSQVVEQIPNESTRLIRLHLKSTPQTYILEAY